MKITRTTAIPLSYRLPEGKTVKLGVGATTKRDTIIVKVETDAGLTGYGEAHPGRSPGAVVSLINNTLNPLIAGMDASDVVGVFARVNRMQLSSHGLGAGAALAVSGIDMALWDIRGKAANMPLYQMLGGSRKRIPAYAGGISMGFQEPASLLDEAREYVERGYKAVKLRLGDNPRDDIARVQAVRAGLGNEIEILTDANTNYTLADARRVIPALAEARVAWLEEPFGCNDHGAYRMGAAISPLVPLAAGENHYTRFEFARLVEERAVQILQPDLSKTGGITEGMRIAAIASAWGLPIHPHSSATGLNHAVSIHYLAALDNGGYFEACVSRFNPLRDMFGVTFEIGPDGCVEPLDRPGIGLDIDESLFAQYPAIDGPGYVVKF
ncbi:MAG: mandelate racemase/muconate lactonizing enzyme family protein [Burkholderiaceae bacterium]|nr:mandelate racemase/muconate lactonizing enzyme family protein [Burkholderiaceae bacterium]MBP7659686.1 mandelate racemase/muconate lactonizing enzyme family protein [Burkholderiaceae bacterium]